MMNKQQDPTYLDKYISKIPNKNNFIFEKDLYKMLKCFKWI